MSNALSTLSEDYLDQPFLNKCGIAKLKDFQRTLGFQIACGQDVFLLSAPGSGETLVMAAKPLVSQSLHQDAIGFLIVPSTILMERHVSNIAAVSTDSNSRKIRRRHSTS